MNDDMRREIVSEKEGISNNSYENISNNSYENIIPFLIFFLALFLFFKIIEPMITIFLSSILITYIFYPLYKKIRKRISNRFLSIILTLLVIVIIFSLPFFYIISQVTQQSFEFYNSLSSNIAKGTIFGLGCRSADSDICSLINDIEEVSTQSLSKIGFDKYLQKMLPLLQEMAARYLIEIPLAVINGVFVLFISYFLFKDGKEIAQRIEGLLPIRKRILEKLVDQFEKVTYAVVFGQLFVALSQGFLATVGFYIFGVPLPIFLGVLTAFCALIPVVGTSVIWVPASLYMILIGYFTQNYNILSKGVWLFVYGILAISAIDNLLRIKIMQSRADVYPIITIIGVVGGVNLFGTAGLFLGPILLPLIITYFETFKERFEKYE
jgi:predicted PurR-regulated permease PerM